VSGDLLGLRALAFFAILAFIVIRYGRVPLLAAFILVCFGYYLGGSTIGALLNDVVMDLAAVIGGVR
jgi:hypothetical protein